MKQYDTTQIMKRYNKQPSKTVDRVEQEIIKDVLQEIGLDTKQKLSDAIEFNRGELEQLIDFGFYDPNDSEQHTLCGNVRNYCSWYEIAFGVPYIQDRPKLLPTDKYESDKQ